MSEYQYVAFRAIDAPVSETNLQFMHKQSTRADITAWSFDNEYHFGDFHGNAAEMLRRGYDFYFHYANYGTRTLMFRLPNGLLDAAAAEPYFDGESLYFTKDKQGSGGVLGVDPAYDAGSFDDLLEPEGMIERLLPLRAEILEGDLRPLYLAHLAVASDMNHDPEEADDVPIPAGLNKLTRAQRAMCEFYGISDALIAAAARNSPPLPAGTDSGKDYAAWLARQPEAVKNGWLNQLMLDRNAPVRAEMLAEFQKSQTTKSWPTSRAGRSVAQMQTEAEDIQIETDRKEAEAGAVKRAKMLRGMAADPMKTVRETDQLVQVRSGDNYHRIAMLLADLREALAGTDQAALPEQQARLLKQKYPTLNLLTKELREQGFLKK
jgi:hypothetical protein